jgi:hypothetical protein
LRVALAAAACVAIAAADAQLPDEPAQIRDAAFVVDPQTAQLASLGFDALIGDLHWIRAVQIVGSHEGALGRSSQIGALIDVVTTLDPWVGHPYRFAAIWMKDDETAIHQANALLRRGIAHHPDDWRNRFYLGFNHFFYLGDEAEAAAVLEPALDLPGSPPYLGRLVARLKGNQGGLDAAAAFLSEMLRSAPPEERKAYEAALQEIETERRARFLDGARAEYVRRHRRDIESVEDLVSGGVLRSLPTDAFDGPWMISKETGQIVSVRLRYRYDVKIDTTNRLEIERFRARSREARGR